MQIATDPGLELQRDLSTRPVTARTAGTILPGNTEDQTWSWPSAWGLCIYSGNTGKDQTLVLWECETHRASVQAGEEWRWQGYRTRDVEIFTESLPWCGISAPWLGSGTCCPISLLYPIPVYSLPCTELCIYGRNYKPLHNGDIHEKNVLNLWDVDYDKATKRLSH